MSNYPPGCTQWHHDRAHNAVEPTPAQINRAQQRMEERARHEAERNDLLWVDWLTEWNEAHTFTSTLSAALRADYDTLRQHMSRLAADYTQHRIAQAQRSREWQKIIEEEA